jgi:type IV pilus assembly protein PilN
MRLNINLATRTYIDSARLNIALLMIALVLLGSLFFNVRAVASKAGEIDRVTHELSALSGKSKGEVAEKDFQALLGQINAANSIITRKTYNWLTLLDKLETVVPDGVSITSIQPETKNAGVKLNGVAGNFSGLRRFVENLEETKYFTDVYLLAQSDTKVGESQSGMTFNITCKVAAR